MRGYRVEDLVARACIQDVLARYCRGIDRMDRALVRSCYHPDATDQHGSFDGTVDAFIEWCFNLLAKYDSTFHMLGNCLIEIGGADAAVAETYGIARHRSERPEPHLNLITGFRYVDRFERRNDEWRIAHRVAITEWTEASDLTLRWPVPPNHLQGRRDRGDESYLLFDPPSQ